MRKTQVQWAALIEQQQSSRLKASEFCRKHRINAKGSNQDTRDTSCHRFITQDYSLFVSAF